MRLVFRPNEAGRRIAYSRARATAMTMAKGDVSCLESGSVLGPAVAAG